MGLESPSAEWSVKLKSSALNSKLPSYTHPHKIRGINLILSASVQRGDSFCFIQRN